MKISIEVGEGERIYIKRMKDKKPKKRKKCVSFDDILPNPTEEEQKERMNTIADGLSARFNIKNPAANKPSYLSEELHKAAMRNANAAIAVKQFQEMDFRD